MQEHKWQFIKKVVLWLLVCFLICTLYILSGQEGAVSHKLSREVVKKASTLIELPWILKHYNLELNVSYNFILRKTAHFSIFFLLAVLLYWAVKSLVRKYIKTLTLACCIFFAGFDELHQMFAAGRTARLTDIIIDILGAICGLLLVIVFVGIGRIKSKKKLKHRRVDKLKWK